jgi:hypothetical protein
MPIGPRSRYQGLPVIDARDAKGASHPTVALRLLAPQDALAVHFQHTIAGLQPIEYLAYKYFGTSDAWWRIADANATRFPLDWGPTETVNIPAGQQVGLVVRTRRF